MNSPIAEMLRIPRWFFVLAYAAGLFSSNIPVIFVHRGFSDYLEHSLWQARQYNEEVILIGDATNDCFDFVHHFDMSDYFSEADRFAHRYVHLSSNELLYELFCIQRWYVIKEFVDRHQIERFFYCDSDVMVYCDVSQELDGIDADVALTDIEGYSGHNSFWSRGALKLFCDFASLFYECKENIRAWEDRVKRGGNSLCDMTLLTEFVRALGQPDAAEGMLEEPLRALQREIVYRMASPRVRVARLSERDAMFDLCNIGHSELGAYALRRHPSGITTKFIIWQNNQPYCHNLARRRFVRFNTLHCQGGNKSLMGSFVEKRIQQ